MRVLRSTLLAVALSTALGGVTLALPNTSIAAPAQAVNVDIPYEEFTLPNGLRVIVHTDRKAPIVAVNIWYHVGSKDEPEGRTGFAHLFEHLMFQGSENHKGEFFAPFVQVGATDQNGTTNSDRTNYFENVPTSALDMALWMESDRMGHLLGSIDQATLDEQRGVVQNEKRQGENRPYGQAWEKLLKATYPKDHPYYHTVIGSMNDLDAASLDDVKQWFRTWYGPNNAVLVLAGDIDLATAKEKVTRYFGDIPAGPTMAQPRINVAPIAETTRELMQDKVPQSMIYRVWNVPETTNPELDQLQILAQVLGGSRSSRLDKRLLHEEKLVDSISSGVDNNQLSSQFLINAVVKQSVDPAKVEAIIDEEIQKLIKDGPTQAELDQAKTMFKGGFIRGIERIGGFGGKADILAECAVYHGDPGCFRQSLDILEKTTTGELQAVTKKWLGQPHHTLVINPGERSPLAEEPAGKPQPFTMPKVDPQYKTTASTVNRSEGVPQTKTFPDLKFPELQRATLANGAELILARRPDVPVVQISHQFKSGFSSDSLGQGSKSTLGLANLAFGMMDEGAAGLSALDFADKAERLGAQLSAGANLDTGTVSLSALKENLAPSIALYADMLRKPNFDAAELDRVKASWIASIQQEKAQPTGAAMRVLPELLYGKGHPYAMPASGTGTEASIAGLTRDDLVTFHQQWLNPKESKVIVVGDTTLEEIVPLLNQYLGDWKVASNSAKKVDVEKHTAVLPAKPMIYLIDQPGAIQANIIAAQLLPSSKDPNAVVFDIANGVLGGDFTARLNMNLREEKHWSYGARSMSSAALGQRPWMAMAPVQIDKTGEALQEMWKEIDQFAEGEKPATADELTRVKNIQTLSLPGAYETNAAVMNTLSNMQRFDYPDNYVFKRKSEVENMTLDQIKKAAGMIYPNALTWVVVGDLKQTEAAVRNLGWGEVRIIDAEGNSVSK